MIRPPSRLGLEPPLGDADLVARCLWGDPTAQRRLFDREYPRVHATLYRILGSNQEVDDLLQEIFFAVFRSLHQFRGEASLATWIERCAVHAAFAHLRRLRGRNHLELVPESIDSGEASAERQLFAREAARRLHATLGRLDPRQRLAFTLHAIDGRSLQEVATLMRATLEATKARVWRARRCLQKRARMDPVLADFVAGKPHEAEGDTW